MTHTITIGIDISKDHLDLFILPTGRHHQYDNSKAGLKVLIRDLKRLPDPAPRIVYEATGRYHVLLEQTLHKAAYHTLSRVNPLQARRFAQSLGSRAKTDRVDARMLAIMGQCLDLPITDVPDQKRLQLKDLQIARQALVKDRTAAKNRKIGLGLPLLMRQNKARLRQIEKDLAAIDQAMGEIIRSDPKLSRQKDILVSIPGISDVTATAMLVELPEIGQLEAKAAASLAGLAPFARESGQYKGQRFIGGGRKYLRDAMYMPALVAARFNPDMKSFYDRLIKKGKPPKLVLTAIMRKLIILANTLIKQDRLWQKSILD